MSTEKIAQELLQQIQPYVKSDEEIFLKHLITEFALRNVKPDDTEDIFRKIYSEIITTTQGNYKWADYECLIDELYIDEVFNNTGLDGLSVYLTQKLSKSEALHCINEIKRILKPYENKEVYECKVSSERYVLLNKTEKIVQSKLVKTNNKGDITRILLEKIINAYPLEVIIHDSPITDMGRTFTFKWTSKTSTRLFETKQSTISEIENYLQEAGWVMNPKYLKGSLAAIIDACITNNLATIRTDIDNPGFYWDKADEKIIKVELELPDYKDNLLKGLKVLDDLKEYTSINKSKLASVLKWGLVAPFSYAKKQMGCSWIPWLYLHGKAKSGKTTIGLIILYLWGKPDQTNNIGGSGFDTVARVGEKLGVSTLPLLVNEPEGALSKPSIMALIKSAIESTNSRGKFKGGKYQNLPSFAPVVMTANMYLPQEDSILRRMFSIGFSHSEKRDDNEAKGFESRFGLSNPNQSPLLDLHYLSSFVYSEVSEEPSLLKLDWKELADTLLTRLYVEANQEMPSWLRLWHESSSLEELDDEEIEDIRMFLIDEINKHSKQIKIYKESGFPEQEETYTLDDGVADNDDFKQRVWNVLNQKLIPWCGVRETRDGIVVYFTQGIKRDISKYTKTCKDLKSISELLNWKYDRLRVPKQKWVMMIPFDDFVEFLYPTLEDELM